MDMLETPGTYDLVTAFAALDHTGLDEVLAKVRSMLNPGGVFFAQIQLWWWVVNTTGILGHFPYAGQRLALNDLTRYFAEHHPEHVEFVQRRYPYFHKGEHPTADEWVQRANQHGLELIAMERMVCPL
ncbi:MAG: class I SAM-dependent methyltransferase [Proteobacteria bacterium]|nr:class I SAM-dependent methyltransferase [Pseudomonadota bacterium]